MVTALRPVAIILPDSECTFKQIRFSAHIRDTMTLIIMVQVGKLFDVQCLQVHGMFRNDERSQEGLISFGTNLIRIYCLIQAD